MKNIKKLISLAILMTTFLSNSGAQKIADLMPNISGWEKSEPVVVDMSAMGMDFKSTSVTYSDGEKEFVVLVVSGIKTMVPLEAYTNIETADAKMTTKEVEGFTVLQLTDKENEAAVILIKLLESDSKNTFLTFNFESMKMEDAMTIAKKFDWKKIKTGVE